MIYEFTGKHRSKNILFFHHYALYIVVVTDCRPQTTLYRIICGLPIYALKLICIEFILNEIIPNR